MSLTTPISGTVCHHETGTFRASPCTKFDDSIFTHSSSKADTTEIVLFSIVASKTLDISQGSVATHLTCGWIFSDNIITNGVVSVILGLAIFVELRLVTDGRTDGQTDRHTMTANTVLA